MSVGENIRNYSVKKKLRALVGVAIVYTLIITIANMVFLSIMENRSMKLYTGPYKTSQIVAYLNVEMQKLNTYAYKVISFTDEAQLMNTVKEIETTTNMIQELIQQLEEYHLDFGYFSKSFSFCKTTKGIFFFNSSIFSLRVAEM